MIEKSSSEKHYRSAQERFLEKGVELFFEREFPKFFGPILRQKIASDLMALVKKSYLDVKRLQPGQILWNALDKRTRGDSPHRRFVPVVLSLVTPQDIDQLALGQSAVVFAENAIARMIREAYAQGGVLSMRDISLLTLRTPSAVSHARKNYETRHQTVLPHTGVLHDMGSCITHKGIILKKIVLEKKDPTVAARECNHTQAAVDSYLNAYNRVKMIYESNQDPTFIHKVTGIAKHVVKQYMEIVKLEMEQL
jgi:hypothetical protein